MYIIFKALIYIYTYKYMIDPQQFLNTSKSIIHFHDPYKRL